MGKAMNNTSNVQIGTVVSVADLSNDAMIVETDIAIPSLSHQKTLEVL